MRFLYLLIFLGLSACNQKTSKPELFEKSNSDYQPVKRSLITPNIDGSPSDIAWKNKTWIPLDNDWEGKNENSVWYKLTWTPDALYILVVIENLKLERSLNNPLSTFENQSKLIVYIDENNSGGNYANDHSAFSYHTLVDGFILDYNALGQPAVYNNHIDSEIKQSDSNLYWEIKLTVFDESYCDNLPNEAVKLIKNKKMGFAIAYSSTDASTNSKNILGSVEIPEDYENHIEYDSGLFSTIMLVE